MGDWKSFLKEDPTDWLLEKDNPSVRYFTLTDILERPVNNSEVTHTKEEIMETGVVPKILAKQKVDGYWDDPRKFYTSKYKGTGWQVIILAELGADGKDDRIMKGCEFLLEHSQDHESGGFSMWVNVKKGGGRHSGVIPCLTGNMVWSLIRLGYLDDPRVHNGMDWMVNYQRFDDGIENPPKGWPYDKATSCFGKHSCHMGVVKSLKALAEIPIHKRSNEVMNIIEKGVEYLLKHHIHKRSHDLKRISKHGWLRLGFPLMYQTDVLEILEILTKLSYKDKRMQETVELLTTKQDQEGRWKLESTFNGASKQTLNRKINQANGLP